MQKNYNKMPWPRSGMLNGVKTVHILLASSFLVNCAVVYRTKLDTFLSGHPAGSGDGETKIQERIA